MRRASEGLDWKAYDRGAHGGGGDGNDEIGKAGLRLFALVLVLAPDRESVSSVEVEYRPGPAAAIQELDERRQGKPAGRTDR